MLHFERSLEAILTNRPAHCADAIVLRSSSFKQTSWENSAVIQLVPFFPGLIFYSHKNALWFCQVGGGGEQGNKSLQRCKENREKKM